MVLNCATILPKNIHRKCRNSNSFTELAALAQGGFKNLQNRSRRRQSAHFSSIIGVLAPTAVGGYDFLKPPWLSLTATRLALFMGKP